MFKRNYTSNNTSARPGASSRGGNFNRFSKPYHRPQRMPNRGGMLNVSDLVYAVNQAKIQKERTPEVEYVAEHKFEDFNISPQLKKNIIEKGYKAPTPIQDKIISVVLEGKDVIGTANTGTGKTAAFLIPLIEKISKNRTGRVLIIAPTRELAVQIDVEFRSFARGLGLFSVLCIGGSNMFYQKKLLYSNPHFVIGTPGRLKDLIKQRCLDLSKFNNVVLDETDRMVDIGFIDEIKFFISMLPKERQSLFFSATVSPKVKEILESFVQNPVSISVKQTETATNVNQEIVRVSRKNKVNALHELLIKEGFSKTLIFGRTKHGVEKLGIELVSRGFKAGSIHGDKRQNQRQRILTMFKKSEINILLATDVASRGLDINDVSHVINYDLPQSYEDYVHRIGRTGRGDKKGVAITLLEVD